MGLADDYQTGTFQLEASIANREDQAAEAKITVTLTNPDGQIINAPPATATVPAKGEDRVIISMDGIGKVMPWSAEKPDLYSYHIVLSDASGKEVAHYAGKAGFRRNEIREGRFLHNGQPVLVKGVNRHDHNPQTGHYVTREDTRRNVSVSCRNTTSL